MCLSHNKVKYNHTHAFGGTWWYNYRLLFTGDVPIYIVMQLHYRIFGSQKIIAVDVILPLRCRFTVTLPDDILFSIIQTPGIDIQKHPQYSSPFTVWGSVCDLVAIVILAHLFKRFVETHSMGLHYGYLNDQNNQLIPGFSTLYWVARATVGQSND